MSDAPPIITDEDKAFAAEHPSLGANWNTSYRIAEAVMADWQDDDFKKIVDKAVDAIGEKLWDSVRDSLAFDTQCNIRGYIRQMVDETVIALLLGERWALERYPLAKNHDGEKIRKAIAEHIPDEIIDGRLSDIAADNAYLRNAVKALKER